MHACLLSLVQMGSYETALSNLADSRVVVSATALQALVDDLEEVRLLLQAQRDVVQSTIRRGEAALKQFGVEVGFIDDLRVCTFLSCLCVCVALGIIVKFKWVGVSQFSSCFTFSFDRRSLTSSRLRMASSRHRNTPTRSLFCMTVCPTPPLSIPLPLCLDWVDSS